MADAMEGDGIEESISVSVRVRPLNSKESKQNCQNVWKVVDGNSIYSTNEGQSSMHTFDNVFDPKTSTRQVYDQVANGLVSSVLQGMNGTVFAYGQTASGKTYTMQGEPSCPGILELAATQVFEEIARKPHYQFLMHVSYIEIFNEQVKDLLTDSNTNLRIREDRDRGFFVDNLEMKSIVSVEELLQAKEEGEGRRHVGETNMNLKSSRSHTIFTLKIEMRDTRALQEQDAENEDTSNIDTSLDLGDLGSKSARGSGSSSNRRASSESDYRFGILVGKLNLVDLAGSENARATGAEGGRLKEGGNINRSLLSLSRVISMLANSRNKAGFINWRDSKLTQILQPSLAGNCRTAIVCCITPASKYLEETRSTLSFASRAKQIRTRAVVNEVLDGEGEMRKLKRTIQELRDALASQKAANAEQSSMQTKIRSLKRLLILGGGVAAGTADSEDEEEAAALAAAAGDDVEAAVCQNMIKSKARRKRKQRETWCPGDFGPKIRAASKASSSAVSVAVDTGTARDADRNAAELRSPPGKQRRSSDTGMLSTVALAGETRDVGTEPVSPVARDDEHKEVQTSLSGDAVLEATEALRTELEELRAEKEAREAECAELASSLVETKAQLEREAEQFKASKEQIRGLLEERSLQSHDLVEELDQLKESIKTKDAQIERLEHAAKQTKEDEVALLESIASEQAGFQKRIEEAVERAEAQEAEAKALEAELAEKQAHAAELQAKLNEIESHKETESSERETSTKQVEAKLEEAKAEHEALCAKLAHLEDVLVQSELDKETSLAELAASKEDAGEVRAKLVAVKAALAECAGMDKDTPTDEVELVAAVRDSLQTQIETLRAEAAELRAGRVGIEAELAEAQAASAELECELAARTAESHALETEVDQIRATHAQIQASQTQDVVGLVLEGIVDKVELAETLSQSETLAVDEAAEARAQLEAVKEELAALQSKLEASESEYAELRESVDEEVGAAYKDVEKQEAAAARLREEKDALESQLEDMSGELTAAQATVQDLRGQIQTAAAATSAANLSQASAEDVQKRFGQLQLKFDLTSQELERATAELQETKAAMTELRNRAERDAEDAASRLESLHHDLEKAQKVEERMRGELKEADMAATRAADDKEGLAQSLREELAQQREEFESKLEEARVAQAEAGAAGAGNAEALRSSVEALERKVGQLKEDLSQERESAAHHRERSSELEETIEQLESKLQAASSTTSEEEIETLQAALKAAEAKATEQSSNADEACKRLEKQRENVKMLEEECQVQAQRAQDAEAAAEAVRSELASAATEVEELRDSKKELVDKLTELHFEASQRSAEDHSETISGLESEVVALKAQLASAATTASEELEASKSDSAAAMEELKAQISALESQLEEATAESSSAEQELKAQIVALEAQLEEATSSKSTSEDDDLAAQIAALKAQLEDAASKSSSVQGELEAQIAALESQLEEVSASKSASEDELKSQIADLEFDLQHTAQGKTTSDAELKAQIAALETQLEESAAASTSMEKELRSQVETLEAQLKEANSSEDEELKAQIAALESELEEVQEASRATAENEELKAQIAALEAQIEASASAKEDMQTQLSELQTQLEERQAAEDDMKQQIAALKEQAMASSGEAEQEHKAQIAALEAQVDGLAREKERAGALEEALLEKEASISSLKREVAHVKEAAAAADAEQRAVQDLQEQLKSREEEVRSAQSDLEMSAASMRQMEDELAALRKELPEMTAAANERIAALQGTLAEREALVNQLRGELAEAGQIAQAEARIAELEEQVAKSAARIQKLEKVKFTQELADKYKKAREDQKKLKMVKVELAEALSSNDALRATQESLRERIRGEAHLRGVAGAVRRSAKSFGIHENIDPSEFVEMVSERLRATLAERDQYEAEVRTLERQDASNDTAERLEAMRAKYVASEKSRVAVEAQLAELIDAAAKADATSGRREQALREANKALEARVAALEASQQATSSENDKGREELMTQLEEHKSNIRFLEKENLDLMVDLRKLRDRAASHALESANTRIPAPMSAKSSKRNVSSGKTPLAGIEANTLAASDSPAAASVLSRKPRGKSISSELSSKTPASVAPSSKTSTSRNGNAPLNDNAAECAQQ